MKLATFFIICFIGIIMIYAFIRIDEWNEERQIRCDNLGIEDGCGDSKIQCAEDCISLGKEYFKWHSGGFGSSSCWCRLNNETKKIW